MSAAAAQTVRSFFEGLAAWVVEGPDADDGLDQLIEEDVVYVEDPRWPGASTYRGRLAVWECWAGYDELIGDQAAVEIVGIVDAGEQVVAVVRFAGRARGSRVPYDHTWGFVCRVDGGELSHFRAYLDPDEGLAAAGRTGEAR